MQGENPTQKLYCYVDETGQDTKGRLFIVVAVVVGKDRQGLINFIEAAERPSGGRKVVSWSKSDLTRQKRYMDLVCQPKHLAGRIYYRTFKQTWEYDRMTAEAIVGAIRLVCDGELSQVKAVIVVDGLNAAARRVVRSVIRQSGIRLDKLRGERDESSPILRLADVMARAIRRATEGL